MISSIRGVLESKGADHVIVDVGGFSLKVYVPALTLAALGPVGEPARLYTYLYLREDNLALYGFATQEEQGFFELLLSVTGIGPRAALNLLSALSPRQLAAAIVRGNADILTHVPGIGRKMAGRLILELKGKIDSRLAADTTVKTSLPDQPELVAALTALGFSPGEAASALAAIPDSPDLTTEDRLRLALRQLAAR